MLKTGRTIVLKTIRVRFRNQSEEHPLSRPHKIKLVQRKDGTTYYCTMNMSSEIKEDLFVTTWNSKEFKQNVSNKTTDISCEPIRVRFSRKEEGKYHRPTRLYKIIRESGEVVYLKELGGKPIDKSLFIDYWEKGPTPVPTRKALNRKYSSKDISKLVAKKLASNRTEARELLDKYESISKVPDYNESKEQTKRLIRNIVYPQKVKGLNLRDITAKKVIRNKTNMKRFFGERLEKKYNYLKQALGNKEITQVQFDLLQEAFIPKENRTFWKRNPNAENRKIGRDRVAIRKRMKDEGTFVKLPLGTKNGIG